MSHGPGKYDDLCELVRAKSGAVATLVGVIGGDKGDGFSVTTTDLRIMEALADILEDMAKQMRADLKAKGSA